MSDFRTIMKSWLTDRYWQLSLYDWDLDSEYTIVYFQGFRVGWIEDHEFTVGVGRHPSYITRFDKLCSADPQLFDKIQDRYKQIGVV